MNFSRIAETALRYSCVFSLAIGLSQARSLAADRPPWDGQYKIHANETSKLTAADVVGPDGIVYPNWTRTGVQGGIPEVKALVKIEDFGGRANDEADDSDALNRACIAAGEKGGGAVMLGEGTYYLDRPVTIRRAGVVIRGQGPDKTKVVFRYALPDSGIEFWDLLPGSRIGPSATIRLHCRPANLVKMTILVDDKPVEDWTKKAGNWFSCAVEARKFIGKTAPNGAAIADGEHRLQGLATYKDGTTLRTEIPVVFDSSYRNPQRSPDWTAALFFQGNWFSDRSIKLTKDGRRGDRVIEIEDASKFAAGDALYIVGPATHRWKQLTQCSCTYGRYREYETLIEKVEGNKVTLLQPLRIDFPVCDGSYVRKANPIQKCGVEDLTIEQTQDIWISSVAFSQAWNCWMRGVTVKKCGRFPMYYSDAKWCEVRNCIFDDAWFKGGGGTAYAGWECSWDCLMDQCTTYKLRHAPQFQSAASGNVIRRSTFHDSDGQWHSGWTHENLIEDCVVNSGKGSGGYGYGLWASPPEDFEHGPNGPRNVVYNCDVSSPKTGLWMGGMNENWLILYNRFIVQQGFGVFAKTASFDHIIRGNVFVLKDTKSSMVRLETADCIGVELQDNVLVGGSGEFCSGAAKPVREEKNHAMQSGEPARSKPAVPSIYEWQLKNVARK